MLPTALLDIHASAIQGDVLVAVAVADVVVAHGANQALAIERREQPPGPVLCVDDLPSRMAGAGLIAPHLLDIDRVAQAKNCFAQRTRGRRNQIDEHQLRPRHGVGMARV